MSFDFTPQGSVEIPGITYEGQVVLPARKTALVVVDMQNDFVKEDGALLVEHARDTIPNIQKLLSSARKAGMNIAYTQDTHFDGDKEWEIWPKHCKRGSWGWEIVGELQPQEEDLVCEKNRYDGFYGTWLDHYLSQVWKTENLVIVGTVSNICVAHTAASAGLRWFNMVIPANGISAMTSFDQALTLRQASSLYAGKVVKDVDDIQLEK